MEMLQRMNGCLQYIEDHLDGKLDLEELARLSCCSKFHFQRMFHMVTGFTLADYIRKRRLTLAAQELTNTNAKVIDVALKYGYETPESFSKAFRKAHGVSPSQVKEPGTSLKAFPRISFHIQLKGEKEMNYRIVERDAFHVIGVGKQVSTCQNENLKEIPLFWNEVNTKGISLELLQLAQKDEMFGMCMDFDHANEELTYFIGVESQEKREAFETKTVPALTWAVFESVGPMPGAIQSVWKRIYSEWFPSTGYEHAAGPEFEVYPPGDVNDPNYRCEVWVPIKKK
ncbi:MAG TPA: AraC family transcriptional regulator [Bacillus sp. (in: firmicutes)]|nr:AraC family transcriptional regulator [Bacillus sp. (in: firmicutes)]